MPPMYLKKPWSSNKRLHLRLVFYLFLSFLFGLLNLLKDLEEESIGEAFHEQMVLFPLTFCFLIGVYHFQHWLTHSFSWFGYLVGRKGFSGFWVWSMFALPISLVMGVMFRVFSLYINDDDGSHVVFDLLFWAISVAIFVAATFVYLLEAYLELEIQEKQFRLRIMEVENEKTLAQYQVLKNQLNPHFLFNSFNTLINLIYLSPPKAEQFVHELSGIYRYNLEQGEELVVALGKEMKLIQAYIGLLKMRFGNGIEFQTQVADDTMDLLLPPMTLTLLVENAVKHNFFDRSHPLVIVVRTEGRYLWVHNTYRPRRAASESVSLGIGLKNLVNQYAILVQDLPVFYVDHDRYTAKVSLIEPDL